MHSSIISILLFCFLISCKDKSGNKSFLQNALSDSSIHVKKDAAGRVAEKWGNYHQADDNVNFRTFFYYDSVGLPDSEKRYIFSDDNTDCIIKDSALYDLTIYHYQFERNKYILEQTDNYTPVVDSTGKVTGRKLYYRHERLKGRDIQKD
jgi:hypothetical protein